MPDAPPQDADHQAHDDLARGVPADRPRSSLRHPVTAATAPSNIASDQGTVDAIVGGIRTLLHRVM
jgi:hypothetical protein